METSTVQRATAQFTSIDEFEGAVESTSPGAFNLMYGHYGQPGWEGNTSSIDALSRRKFRPRVLRGASAPRRTTTTVLGTEIALPIMIAPSGSHQRCHPDGELAMARAAQAAGTIMALAVKSNFTIEEVAEATDGPLWFQFYPMKDQRLTEALAARAAAAGYQALVLTVDNLCMGSYPGTIRTSEAAADMRAPSLDDSRLNINFSTMPFKHDVVREEDFTLQRDDAFTWEDLASIRSLTDLPLVLKGIQTAEDAELALQYGADALWVSNHGGTVLLDARGTLDALEEVVAVASAADVEVYVDGGVRNGADVLKALALGARAVFVGRAPRWGLTLGGQEGVEDVFRILLRQLDWAMGMCGLKDLQSVQRSLLAD